MKLVTVKRKFLRKLTIDEVCTIDSEYRNVSSRGLNSSNLLALEVVDCICRGNEQIARARVEDKHQGDVRAAVGH